MLEIVLTASDGGTSWRHLLAAGESRAGWECVGPLGLARRIGRLLGVAAQPAAAPDRLAAYAARLDRQDDGRRSYSASRSTDPFGVAAHLLSLRDRLRLAGWRGSSLSGSARLQDLASIEALDGPALPAGFGDVVHRLLEALDGPRTLPVPTTIRLAAPRDALPPLVLRLLGALARAGAELAGPAPDAPAAAIERDLGKLQRALLDPSAARAALAGDGSFLLLEADTPLEAAELAAAILRREPLGTTTVVAAGESGALDAALSRQGLPALGSASPSRFRPHLQALPLRLALAFRPRDPFRAAELLLLPGAPLPSQPRRKLLGALAAMPGVGSPAWRDAAGEAVAEATRLASDEGASEVDAMAAGQALADRIEDWFGGEDFDPREGIPCAGAAAICGMVAGWAGARSSAAVRDGEPLDPGLWAQAATVARTLQRVLVGRPPTERISQLALAQLHDVAAGDGSSVAAFEGEAGRPAVCGAPADVLPGPSTVLWFGLVEGAAAACAPEPWIGSERSALAAAGVEVGAPGQARAFEAWGWRRPVLAARDRLVLVRWRLAGAKAAPPHAFLDELRTRVAPGSLECCTIGSERMLAGDSGPLAPSVQKLPPAAAVAPRPVWRVPPPALEPRGALSATALEALLGCPFAWALSHQALLRPGRGVDLPDGSRLLGDFAHRLLQDMLLGDGRLDPRTATRDEATGWALRAFDARVASEAAPLVRPGREVERDAARTLVGGAAAALVRHLQAGGWTVKAAEDPVAGSFAGLPVQGYVDLVLERAGRPGLLDLKLSGARYRRDELAKGQALQLALYASMLRNGGEGLPPAGFLTLDDGQLITTSGQAFPGASEVDGPSTQETLKGAERAFTQWKGLFAKGLLPVCSEALPWEEALARESVRLADGDGPGRRDPPCLFCKVTTLCRARIGEEERP